MKHGLVIAAFVAATCIGLAPASADLLSFNAELHVGLADGSGLGGEQSDRAFHKGASGLAYGGIVGVEVLWIDGWVEHNQFQDTSGLAGTWTQFMVGLDKRFDLSDKSRGDLYDAKGKLVKAGSFSPLYGEIGVAVGFGVGTGQQIELPLDNSEISDKGFLAQAHLGFGYRISRLMSFGVTIPMQVSYMFKNGAANDESNQYRSAQGGILANFRLRFQVK